MSMATRALAAVVTGRRAAEQSGLAAVLSSCRRGGARSLSHSSAAQQRREEQSAGDHHDAAAAVTAEQVEASLNRKNVEVVQGDGRSATLVPDEVADALGGVGAEEAAEAWVPDEETGVFVPAEEAAANGDGNGNGGSHGQPAEPSVLDQAVFVRDDMEDVERPPVDMASAHGGGAE